MIVPLVPELMSCDYDKFRKHVIPNILVFSAQSINNQIQYCTKVFHALQKHFLIYIFSFSVPVHQTKHTFQAKHFIE